MRLYLNPSTSNAFDITAAGALGKARCSGLATIAMTTVRAMVVVVSATIAKEGSLRLRNALGLGGQPRDTGQGRYYCPM